MCFASTLASRPPSFAFLDLRNEHRQQPSIFYHSPTFTERIVARLWASYVERRPNCQLYLPVKRSPNF